MGCEGWGFDDVLPYFKRGEDNERGEDAFHGAGGPLSVSESRSMHPLIDTMIEAAQAAGHEHNPDFNGARQEGVGRFQLTQRDGLRWQLRGCLPAPGEGAAQPRRDHRRAGHADPVRGRPRRRRRDRREPAAGRSCAPSAR